MRVYSNAKLVYINSISYIFCSKVFEMGAGINFGLVVAGAIGSVNRFTYSVIGDEVNLAARLEGLTRHYPVDIILAESVFERLTDEGKTQCFLLDCVQVKGKKKKVLSLNPNAPSD